MFHHDVNASYCVDNAGLVLASKTGDDGRNRTEGHHPAAPRRPARPSRPNSRRDSSTPTPAACARSNPRPHRRAKPTSRLPATPAGFTLVGRYAVVALSDAVLERSRAKSRRESSTSTSVASTAIVIDRGGRLDTSDVSDDDLGVIANEQTVDLGALGEGRAGIGGIGPFGYREVRFAPSQGRYVVVAGTLPLDELVALARSLRTIAGHEARLHRRSLSPRPTFLAAASSRCRWSPPSSRRASWLRLSSLRPSWPRLSWPVAPSSWPPRDAAAARLRDATPCPTVR